MDIAGLLTAITAIGPLPLLDGVMQALPTFQEYATADNSPIVATDNVLVVVKPTGRDDVLVIIDLRPPPHVNRCACCRPSELRCITVVQLFRKNEVHENSSSVYDVD